MKFQMTDGWIVVTTICYAVALIVALWVRRNYRPRYEIIHDGWGYVRRALHPRWYAGLWQGMATLVIICAVGNAASYGLSHSYDAPDQTTYDVAETFGFESGRSYPLALGTRLGGSSSVMSGYRASFTVREKSGSDISLGFNNEGRSYILEIPTSKTTFIVDDTQPASMRLYLNDVDNGLKRVTFKSPCTVVVESGVLACSRTIDYGTSLSDEQMRQGLGNVVQQSFSSAEIVLPQSMYDSILGKK